MRLKNLISGVVSAAVAVSAFSATSGAYLIKVEDPHEGTISTDSDWGVELYNAEKGIDYGIDLSEIASMSFIFAATDIEWFSGQVGGYAAIKFLGGDVADEYEFAYSTFWGVEDEYLGLNTQHDESDILAETLALGIYTIKADIDNPLANGEAETVDEVTILMQEYGFDVSDYVVLGAFVYDDEGNILMSFNEYGVPIDYYVDILSDTVDEAREKLVARETEFSLEYELDNMPGEPLGFTLNLLGSAMEHTGVPNEGDYLYYNCMEYGIYNSSTYVDRGAYYDFDMDCYADFITTKSQETAVNTKVNDIMNTLDLDGKTDYQKICAIYSYICSNVDYDYDALETGDLTAHSAFAALCKGKAVCQGYATAIYRLMLEAGIDCRVVVGFSGDELHAWNIVELDDKYYYIDSTWDSNFDEFTDYEWFLKGTNDFEDHEEHALYELNGYNVSETNYIPHNHVMVKHNAKAPTCTEDGWNEYEECSICGYSTYEELEAIGHKYTDYTVTEEATCETKGSCTAECDNGCGEKDTKVIDALGHNYEASDNGYVCKTCGEEVEFIYGDANSDGKVNNIDVLLMRKSIAGGWEVTVNEDALDVNCDGKINNIDVLLLRKFIAGGWGVTLGTAA